jgi:rhodanese-related sulfurtransferase
MHRIAPAVAALALLAAPLAPRADDPFEMISIDEVAKLLGTPGVRVYDANTRQTYEEAHLPGATFVTSKTVAKELPQDKDARLIYYCKNPK